MTAGAVSGKLHYSAPGTSGKTLCGRVISGNLRVTADPNAVTCIRCYGSRWLDGELGNMTHTGH